MKNCQMVVCIVDISGFAKTCREKSDQEIYQILDKFYILVETIISEAGGEIVKFMGDSALMVFELEKRDPVEQALQKLKVQSDNLWQKFNAECKLNVKSDVCSLICGEMGLTKRFDIVGKDLNELFMRDWD